jgi:hypothetical protein
LNRFHLRDHHFGDLLLQIAVAQTFKLLSRGRLVHFPECPIDRDEIRHTRSHRLPSDSRVGVSRRPHDLLASGINRIQQTHGMVRAGCRLRHLLIGLVQSHDASAHGGQLRFRDDECLPVEGIEPLGDVASELEMLGLVVTHGHDSRLIKQNIGRHQHRILQQPIADRFLSGGLCLELCHPFQPSDRSDAG